MTRRTAPLVAALALLTVCLVPATRAAAPQFWRIEGAKEFLEGEISGLSVDSLGRVRLGVQPKMLHDPSTPAAWAVARDAKGTLYVGTGNDGRLIKVSGGAGSVLWDAEELQVHAVAVGKDGRVYAGTSPGGAVYAIDASGKATRFFDPEETYIWALAFDAKGLLYVATGGDGRVYRVTPDGKGEAVITTSDTHVLSLAFDSTGRLFAGTAPEGLVYRLDTAGKVFVALDSSYREIRSLAPGPAGSIYAAGIDGRTTSDTPAKPQAQSAAAAASAPVVAEVTVSESFSVVPQAGAAPVQITSAAEQAASAAPKGALLRLRDTGEVDTLWISTEDVPHSVLAIGGDVLVGTGNKGKLYRVRPDGDWALVATLPAEQVTALGAGDAGGASLVTSNPARVYSVAQGTAREGTFTSKVKDSQASSTWGRVAWEGSFPPGTSVRVEARSGNTITPDATWTDWSAPLTRSTGEAIPSERARYLQLRLTLLANDKGNTPTVEALSAAYLQRNLPPEVKAITIHPPGEAFQKPISVSGEPEILGLEVDPLSERAATQRPAAGSPSAVSFSRKLYQKGLRTFSWQADDPNQDPLVYEVQYRSLGDERWRTLRKGLDEAVLAWDTSNVPNGRYVVRVLASDAPGNPPALALGASRDSASFQVDNAPPSLTATFASATRDRVRATVKDDASPVRRLEMSVDAGKWEEVHPVDGISDSPEETYEIAVPRDAHIVVLRATDILGNVATVRVSAP